MDKYEEERKTAIENINNVKPNKPKLFKKDDIYGFVFLLFITFILFAFSLYGDWLVITIFIAIILLDFGFIISHIKMYNEANTQYKFMCDDFESFKEQEIEKINDYFDNKDDNDKILEAQAYAIRQQNIQKQINKPKCPTCGSTETHKIGTATRVAGVAVLGLASSDIGKTMKCDKCGYKW